MALPPLASTLLPESCTQGSGVVPLGWVIPLINNENIWLHKVTVQETDKAYGGGDGESDQGSERFSFPCGMVLHRDDENNDCCETFVNVSAFNKCHNSKKCRLLKSHTSSNSLRKYSVVCNTCHHVSKRLVWIKQYAPFAGERVNRFIALWNWGLNERNSINASCMNSRRPRHVATASSKRVP
jgi:hypothetical protein